MLENVRFNPGEKKDDETLAKAYAGLCEIFVMDAFGTAHRAQASTHGVAKFAPVACAGPLLARELSALEKALAEPARPMVAIVGGSKVSTKLTVLETLSDKVDQLVVGGGIANTFLAAAGKPVGKSLCEHDLIPAAKSLMEKTSIPLPVDVVTGKEFSASTEAEYKLADQVVEDDMIFDIGPEAAEDIATILKDAGTILWNGPVGVFEFDQFGGGTEALSLAIAESMPFRWPAVATPWRRSTNTTLPTIFHTFPPAAGLSWNTWRVRLFLRLPCLKRAQPTDIQQNRRGNTPWH